MSPAGRGKEREQSLPRLESRGHDGVADAAFRTISADSRLLAARNPSPRAA